MSKQLVLLAALGSNWSLDSSSKMQVSWLAHGTRSDAPALQRVQLYVLMAILYGYEAYSICITLMDV